MILKAIKWFAKRSHNIRVQATLATFYGLISIFGFNGAFAIVMKLGKQERQKHASRKTNG